MIIEELDFFKDLLPEEFINKYIEFSNEEDNNEVVTINNCMLVLSLYTALGNDINNNYLSWQIFVNNIFRYFGNVIISFERVDFFEEHIKSVFFQLKSEREILTLLKRALIYSDRKEVDMKSNNVSRIFLLLASLEVVRKRRVMCDDRIKFLVENADRGFVANYYVPYSDEDINLYLEKIKYYSKKLKRRD